VSTRHTLSRSILREYDIRGTVGKDLTRADAEAIGRSFGTLVADAKGRSVCVGYDGRVSSPDLEAAVVAGLNAAGIDAICIGRGPTPMLYYATRTLGADGGIMITGSHNPPDQNGFKMMIGTKSFYGADIQRLGEIAAKGDVRSGQGGATKKPVFHAYLDQLHAAFDGTRPLTVAWDPGNGATGEVVADLVKRLPGRHLLINEKIDGTFPSHHPDPTVPENLVELQQLVARENCDLGIAFDGDGDRIGVIDGRGRILWGDQIMVILAEDVLKARPGATIIADVKASQVLFDEVARMGGKPLMWRTGHSLIKTKLAETGAPLAGEMSGHIFFADRYYGFDDAIYAAVRLLGIVSRSAKSLADRRDAIPTMLNTPELRFPVSAERKFAIIDEVKARLKGRGANLVDIDGVRVMTEDGWWLLRASNTQEVLVARCEARTQAGLERMKAALRAELTATGVTPPAL